MKKIIEKKEQALLFSQFTSVLNILEDFCVLRGIEYCRLDGTTPLEEREQYIDDFTKPKSKLQLFLISTRAGGLGLNLMTANHVIIFDSDWNP